MDTDISNILEQIRQYFIDDNIKIPNENINILDLLNLYILKYRRIIAAIFLIILIYLLFCEINTDYNDCSDYANNNMIGGGGAVASIGSKLGSVGSKLKGFASKKGEGLKKGLTKKMESIKKAPGKLGSKALSGKTYKNLGSSAFSMGESAASSFKQSAPIFYQILYTLAFTLIIAILVLPSIGFFIIGIICYFLLKDRIKTLKGF